jgi:hypothetical protein
MGADDCTKCDSIPPSALTECSTGRRHFFSLYPLMGSIAFAYFSPSCDTYKSCIAQIT